MPRQGMFIVLVFYLLCPANIIGIWWAVGSPLIMDPNRICKKSRRVGGKQQRICLKEPELVDEIANGAKMAIAECRYQFKDRRWNCTTKHRGIAKVLKLDTKEAAFVNSISAAGVVYAVTQACTMGLLLQCTCGRHNHSIRDQVTDGQWEWGGCGDDVNYGYRKSREFMDRKRKKKKGDIRTKLHLHNNEAGRLAVKQYMRTVCKCHGLSGSCTLKTCWRKMPLFRHVGKRLMNRFDSAMKVTISNDGAKLIPSLGWTSQEPTGEDLVFSSESPDYCKPDRKAGSHGTMGRLCNVSSGGRDGCDIMCCGRGYQQQRQFVEENCKCRFKWCCEVDCQTCLTEKIITRCN